MIKAGSLTYSLFLLFLSAMLSFLLQLLYWHYYENYAKLERYARVWDNCESGIQMALAKNALTVSESYGSFENWGALQIRKRPWGAFSVISSEAVFQTEMVQKVGLVASLNQDIDGLALWLANENSALKVCGSTKIKGDVRLPKKGIETTRLGESKFEGNQLFTGTRRANGLRFPQVPVELESYWRSYISGAVKDDSLIVYRGRVTSHQPFSKTSLLYRSWGTTYLTQDSLSGNIILSSDAEIIIDSTAKVDNVILIAPRIRILAGAHLRAHLIATQSIEIGEGVKMAFPSSIMLFSAGDQLSHLEIKAEAQIRGLIIADGISELYRSNKPLVTLRPGAQIVGTLICTGFIEHQGKIAGHLVAKELCFRDKTGFYENTLFNGIIDNENDNVSLFMPVFSRGLFGQGFKEEVLGWL